MTARTKFASALLLLTFAFSATTWSQDTQAIGSAAYLKSPERYFRLTFRVLDLSPTGKVTDARSYDEIIASGPKSLVPSSIRTNDRVQVATGGKYQSGMPEFYTFELGTKIDARHAAIVNDSLCLHITASLSSISTVPPGSKEHPVIRQTSWDSNVTVSVDKPTIIFSSDNSADKGKTELELTAKQISQ